MINVGVFEKDSTLIISLKKALKKYGLEDVALKMAEASDTFDIVLIGTHPPDKKINFKSKILIVPDCMSIENISPHFHKSVISYGLRSKNTLTVSSLICSSLVITLQRKIPNLNGEITDEQEFTLVAPITSDIDSILGIISTLLALGISPKDISDINF